MPVNESRATVRSIKPRVTVCSDHQCETKECGCDSGVCPSCGLKWMYLGGQKYCPTCEFFKLGTTHIDPETNNS